MKQKGNLYIKSGLPEEIKESLNGGDAGEGRYVDYASLNDVYGVTENLKVYYCASGINSVIGLALENIDDIKERIVFSNEKVTSGLGKLLIQYDTDDDGLLSSNEVKSVKSLMEK